MPNRYNTHPGNYIDIPSYNNYRIISPTEYYYNNNTQPFMDGYNNIQGYYTATAGSLDGYYSVVFYNDKNPCQLSLDFDDLRISAVPKLIVEKIIKDGDLLIPKFNYEVDYKVLKAIGLFVKNKIRDDLSEKEFEIVVEEIATAFIQKLQKENKLSYSLNTKKFRYIE